MKVNINNTYVTNSRNKFPFLFQLTFLSGNGKAIIDGEEISLSTGDWLKIAPAAKRQFFASDISGITYICIQVKENSLEHFSAEDGVIG